MPPLLAQINIARLLAPLDSPLLADFVADLDRINAIAEQSPGFVWRLKDDSGNATAFDPFNDKLLVVNLSVWENVDALRDFAFRSEHLEVYLKRAKWFEKMDKSHLALWWVSIDEPFPDAAEGRRRLLHLQERGESRFAFSFKKIFQHHESCPI